MRCKSYRLGKLIFELGVYEDGKQYVSVKFINEELIKMGPCKEDGKIYVFIKFLKAEDVIKVGLYKTMRKTIEHMYSWKSSNMNVKGV